MASPSRDRGWTSQLWFRLNNPADVRAAVIVAAFFLLFEAFMCDLIVTHVPYTEIDWQAYMQEVQGYQDGELDYAKLRGDTGPLVYPAGFVYLFSWLQQATGGAVRPAQTIYTALYLATQAVVMAMYIKTRSVPPWTLALLCLSRRLHSIFLLRLFNDCWAMFVAYVATYALQCRRWALAVLLYSLAVSLKMNVLLFAPGVLAVLIKEATVNDVARGVAAGVVLQLVLGAPFLLTFPQSYVSRAFEFSRAFTYKWSVNWQFIPEDWFLSKRLALALLFLHMRLLWSFADRQWFATEGGVLKAVQRFWQQGSLKNAARAAPAPPGSKGSDAQRSADSGRVLHIIFAANFVGVLCARSLHYQFYSWYFHSLPFLLLRSQLPVLAALPVLLCIELVWNMYPPRAGASLVLLLLHIIVFVAARLQPAGPARQPAVVLRAPQPAASRR